MAVDAVVYYRVQNATISITNVEDAARSTRLLAATTLRNVLGTKNLSEILADREQISHLMQVREHVKSFNILKQLNSLSCSLGPLPPKHSLVEIPYRLLYMRLVSYNIRYCTIKCSNWLIPLVLHQMTLVRTKIIY